jgi:hypothetical protein
MYFLNMASFIAYLVPCSIAAFTYGQGINPAYKLILSLFFCTKSKISLYLEKSVPTVSIRLQASTNYLYEIFP